MYITVYVGVVVVRTGALGSKEVDQHIVVVEGGGWW